MRNHPIKSCQGNNALIAPQWECNHSDSFNDQCWKCQQDIKQQRILKNQSDIVQMIQDVWGIV